MFKSKFFAGYTIRKVELSRVIAQFKVLIYVLRII